MATQEMQEQIICTQKAHTTACNQVSHPRAKIALRTHAEPPSEPEHPRSQPAARRRGSTPSSTPLGRAHRAPLHDPPSPKPRTRGSCLPVRSPNERSGQGAKSRQNRGSQHTCHARATYSQNDITANNERACMRESGPAIELHRLGQGKLVTGTLHR